MIDKFKSEIARNIKKRREELGYTQEELGRLVGKKRNTIASIEACIEGKAIKCNLFPLSELPKYVKALKCNPEELLSPLFEPYIKDNDLFDMINKIKKLRNHSNEWESLKVMINSLMLSISQYPGIDEKEKRIQRGDG